MKWGLIFWQTNPTIPTPKWNWCLNDLYDDINDAYSAVEQRIIRNLKIGCSDYIYNIVEDNTYLPTLRAPNK